MLPLLYSALLMTATCAQEVPHCHETARTSTGGTISSVNYDRRSLEAHSSGNCVYKVRAASNYLQFRVTNIERPLEDRTGCADAQDCCRHLRLGVLSDQEDEHVLCANNITLNSVELTGSTFEFSYMSSDFYPHAMRVTFTTSKLCKSYQYQCVDATGCYQKHEICDRFAHCVDGSDEVQCARRTCTNYFIDDEYFLCKNGKCVKPLVVRNGVDDCGDGSDERLILPKNAYFSLLLGVLVVTFLALLMRWYLFRRDVHVILENLPEFPLPPFVAPGENPTPGEEPGAGGDNACNQVDVQAGGDIYQGYVEGMRTQSERSSAKAKSSRSLKTSLNATATATLSGGDNAGPEQDDSVSALQSLSIDLDLDITQLQGLEMQHPSHSNLLDEYIDLDVDESELVFDKIRLEGRARAHSETVPKCIGHFARSPKSKSAGNTTNPEAKINFIETLREINNSLTLSPKQLTSVTVHRERQDEDYFELRDKSNRSKCSKSARTEHGDGHELDSYTLSSTKN